MPQLIRFVLLHTAIGFGISAVFVALLMSTDTNGLAVLLRGAESHPLPALLLWFFCGLTFASVQIGTAVMLLAHDDPPEPRGGRRIQALVPALLPPGLVPVRSRRR